MIGLSVAGSFIGMLATVYVLILVAEANYLTPSIAKCPGRPQATYVNWLHVEIIFNLGIVLSNVLFMIIRSCTKHKIYLENSVDEKKKVPFIDTLAALKELTGAWNNELLPCIIS